MPGIETRPLYDEPFRVVVPRGHAWARRKRIAADEVRGDNVLVLKAGNCFREQVLDACPDISHAEGSLHQGHSFETIRCMVASGYGISVLPAGVLGGPYRPDMVCAIPFDAPEPTRRVALAWRRGFSRPEAIAAIVAAVQTLNNPAYTPIGSRRPPVSTRAAAGAPQAAGFARRPCSAAPGWQRHFTVIARKCGRITFRRDKGRQ